MKNLNNLTVVDVPTHKTGQMIICFYVMPNVFTSASLFSQWCRGKQNENITVGDTTIVACLFVALFSYVSCTSVLRIRAEKEGS